MKSFINANAVEFDLNREHNKREPMVGRPSFRRACGYPVKADITVNPANDDRGRLMSTEQPNPEGHAHKDHEHASAEEHMAHDHKGHTHAPGVEHD